MIEVNAWVSRYVEVLTARFGDRVWFVGLQGSCARGEAREGSDIDMVVVLDRLAPEDIAAYDAMLDTIGQRSLACGFLGGKDELLAWEPSELFQFCHDTTPILGCLDEVLARVDADAVDRAIRSGACSVYHGCVHNMLYDRDEGILRGLCKAATFAVRASVYRQTGVFCRRMDELADRARGLDRQVAVAWLDMKGGAAPDFRCLSELLFLWAREKLVPESEQDS